MKTNSVTILTSEHLLLPILQWRHEVKLRTVKSDGEKVWFIRHWLDVHYSNEDANHTRAWSSSEIVKLLSGGNWRIMVAEI